MMKVTKEDSELHSAFSTLLNQHPKWNDMPTQNVGALQVCFEWFNKVGERIDEALKAEEEAQKAESDKDAQTGSNNQKAS